MLGFLTENEYVLQELSFDALSLDGFIAASKRVRFDAELFRAIEGVLVREVETRLETGDRGLSARVRKHLAALPEEALRSPGGVRKVALNGEVMTYLFADAWGTGRSLMAAGPVKAAVARRAPAEVLAGFLDLVDGLKRFEILCQLRDRVRLGRGPGGEEEIEEKVRGGVRVFDFGESARVLNNAVNATVLFLDLRGFTETSEGVVSERDLTRELYTVFDAFVPHVLRFGGTVDKFLGDGMMVTFGTRVADAAGPLNAVRTAILCQQTLEGFRREERSSFRMGVSVHFGRVYAARFYEDADKTQATVIGRNVNLAGRLSSSAKVLETDEGEVEEPTLAERRVSIGEDGSLVNEGIAMSRAALLQLEQAVELERLSDESGSGLMRFEDEALGRPVLVRYVGDAKFKGVQASFPVFEVDPEEP